MDGHDKNTDQNSGADEAEAPLPTPSTKGSETTEDHSSGTPAIQGEPSLPEIEEILPPDVLDALSAPGMPESAKQTVEIYLRRVFMSGPIPPPAIIREYGEIVPGLDRKIVEWADTQHNARLAKEKLVTEGAERRMDRAQRNFLIIGVLGLLLAAAVGTWGNAWVASVIAVVAIGGPSAANILSRGIARGVPGEIGSRMPGQSPEQSSKPRLPQSQQRKVPVQKQGNSKRKQRRNR